MNDVKFDVVTFSSHSGSRRGEKVDPHNLSSHRAVMLKGCGDEGNNETKTEAEFDELSKKQYFAWHPMKMNYSVSAKTLSFIMPRGGGGDARESKDKTSKKLLSCRGRNQS